MKFARMSLMFAIALSEASVYANVQKRELPGKGDMHPNPNQMIVTAPDNDSALSSEIAALSMNAGVQTLSSPPGSGNGRDSNVIFVAQFQSQEQLNSFQQSAGARGVRMEVDAPMYLDPVYESDATESNRRLQGQEIPWGINRVYANDGTSQMPWANGGELPDVTKPMCIIDSGYYVDHPDLPNGAVNAGSDGDWNQDGCQHGSHVAGTIVASNNDEGVVGVFPGAPTKIVKVFATNCVWFYTSGLIGAMNECVTAGASIINMSLGGGAPTTTLQQRITQMYDDLGVLIIAAAGNNGTGSKLYPASYDEVMSVAATDSNDNTAGFSQFNDKVDIAGPGVSVKSTGGSVGLAYNTYSGTSMASPHVAGVAFLLWNQYPDCTNDEIRHLLESTAIDKGDPGRDDHYGHGIVNYWAAKKKRVNDGDCTIHVEPTAAPTVASTVTCPSRRFTLDLKIDNYGGETSWHLFKTDGTEVESSGGISYAASTLYKYSFCVDDDVCEFTIKDTYGDGICCNYGSGFYKISIDGAEFVEGGNFGSSKTHQLCSVSPTTGPVVSPTTAPVVPPTTAPVVPPTSPPTAYPTTTPTVSTMPTTGSPTTTPSASPTTTPSASPTTTPTVSLSTTPTVACTKDDVTINLKLDAYPGETSWVLTKYNGGAVVATGGSYAAETVNETENYCLDPECYVFTMLDSYGDGLCCEHGNGEYSLTLNGDVIVEGSVFGQNEITLFGSCTDTSAAASFTNYDEKGRM